MPPLPTAGRGAAAAGAAPTEGTYSPHAAPPGSRNSIASPYRVMNDTDMLPDTSLLQSLNPPQPERGLQSSVLGQAYDLLDSMGPLPDHSPVPLDYLDTAAMISVPQVRLTPRLLHLAGTCIGPAPLLTGILTLHVTAHHRTA